jgi:2-oxoglutarate dehydrogenase E2 component (dihydrolipoamide succinyltransferase)
MGESIAEGTISRWLKKVGESVQEGEALFEVSSDKVDAEIPSPFTGILRAILVEVGTTVAVDTIVAHIETTSAAPESPTPTQAPTAPPPPPATALPPITLPEPSTSSAHATTPMRSSPLVRKIAATHGIDLAQVPGTGLGGRITKADILAWTPQTIEKLTQAPTAPSAPTAAPVASSSPPSAYLAQIGENDQICDLSIMRQKIADHMVWSKRISPHVGTLWEIDFSHIARLRTQYKKSWKSQHGLNLTYTAFIAYSTLSALSAHPLLNASIHPNGTQWIQHADIHLGIAVAIDAGLIVPVIHTAQDLSFVGLTKRMQDLAGRARDKKLKPHEVQNGTFTISNPGSYGAMFNIPVINQPQVAILGVGTVEKRPVVIDDMIAIRTRAYLSLSFDHRLIDGALADQFMLHLKQHLESFPENAL